MIENIKGKPEGEIDEKRFYLPGVVVNWKCDNCGHQHVHDFYQHHLSYPKMNVLFDETLWFTECNHEETVKLMLRINLVTKKPEKSNEVRS